MVLERRAGVSGDIIRVGNVEIVSLTDADCEMPFPLDTVFPNAPAAAWDEHKQRHPEAFSPLGLWQAHVGSLLLRSGGRTVMVDTGIGPEPVAMLGGAAGTLTDDITAKGINLDEVSTVVLTHLHFDHVGWNMLNGQPLCPRARYVMGEADWEFFSKPEVQANFPPYFDRTLGDLKAMDRVDLVSGETTVTDEITLLPTPGHTPGHLAVLISSNGEKALITGDMIVHPAQVSEPGWIFGFDADADQAVATRRQVLDRLEAEGIKLIGCHFPSPGFGSIVRVEGKRYFQGV
jgi:glyoxylase-like metal-dependent hydrolase (beta-lactamase superfamily II)